MAQEALPLGKSQPSSLDSGVFTWDISSNQFFADSALALLFGLEPENTMAGLPMEQYLDRVHPDDKSRVAHSIHNAIVSGAPCQQNYRVRSSGKHYTEIMSFGRCFRNSDGAPSQYAGIVYPVVPVVDVGAGLIDLCAQTHRAALRSGRLDIARTMRGVLQELNHEPASAPHLFPN